MLYFGVIYRMFKEKYMATKIKEIDNLIESLDDPTKDWQGLGVGNKFVLKSKNKTPIKKEEIFQTVENEQIVNEVIIEKPVNTNVSEDLSPVSPVVNSIKETPLNDNVVKSSENQLNLNNFNVMKLIAIGLTHLYVKRTTKVLNPIKFIVENLKTLMFATAHLGIPALITWFCVTKVEFIASQIPLDSVAIYWTYVGMFYIASLLLWITLLAVCTGIGVMVRNTLLDVAKKANQELS